MPKFTINKDYNDPETVEADSYSTVGNFIDFVKWDGETLHTVLRIQADRVYTVHMDTE